jgi:hypothetical protein
MECKERKVDNMFGELLLFKERWGHCCVPTKYPENISLGKWVSVQRTAYNKGKLEKDRVTKLDK